MEQERWWKKYTEDESFSQELQKRLKRAGFNTSRNEEVLDPAKAELQDILETQHYPLRKIDIARLGLLAGSAGVESQPHVLDLGGGRGFLAKLLADYFSERQTDATITDFDVDEDALKKAEIFYKDSVKGLRFIVGDIIKDSESAVFTERNNLVITSWLVPENCSFSQAIEKLNPAVYVNIGEERRIFTGKFRSEKYRKIAEWFGPMGWEVVMGELPPPHSHIDEETIQRLRKTGSNLFEVFVRNDVGEEEVKKLTDNLKNLDLLKPDEYKWEEELKKRFPEKTKINFDPDMFWQKDS